MTAKKTTAARKPSAVSATSVRPRRRANSGAVALGATAARASARGAAGSPHLRLWYGSLRLAPVEMLVAIQPIGFDQLPRRIHARVADTNIILNQVVASVRRAEHVAMLVAIRDGGLRLHVAPTIPDEIEEHMPKRAQRQGLSIEKARALWRDELAPRVRVVEVGEPDRLELAAVAERDEDDLPTAALAAILGPGSTWSGDKDLIEPGLAEPYVLELVIAIREVCVFDAKIVATARGAEIIAALGTELVRAIGRLDTRDRLVTGVFVIAAIGGAAILLRRNPHWRQPAMDALERIGQAVLQEIGEGYERQQAAIGKVPPPLDLGTPRPERAIARVLAAAPVPLTVDEIRRSLRGQHATMTEATIGRHLGEHRMFVLAGRGLWQLGRRLP